MLRDSKLKLLQQSLLKELEKLQTTCESDNWIDDGLGRCYNCSIGKLHFMEI